MNFDKYTEEMRKSIWDKAFFMDKIIGEKFIVDFGCADGALICMLADMFPEMKFYGYDHLPEMIDRARKNARYNTYFYNSWELSNMCEDIQLAYESNDICLNFS
jgi:trans-aconitate methyltransferase